MARHHKSMKKQSEMSRYREHAGEERALHGYHEKELNSKGGYSSYNSSQLMMKRDSSMIREDWSAACLLPTNVIEKQWPGIDNGMKKGIVTLFSGEQEMMREDRRNFDKANKPKLY